MHTAHPTLLCVCVCLSVCLTVSEASEKVKQDQSCTFSVQWRAVYQSQELREVGTYGMHFCGVVWCGVVWCGVVWCGMVWCGDAPCFLCHVNKFTFISFVCQTSEFHKSEHQFTLCSTAVSPAVCAACQSTV